MGQPQYTSLLEALAVVPDPRKARGKRYCWLLLLTLLAAGLASGQQTARAIAHWLRLHATELKAALPQLVCIPSESSLLRTLRLVDVAVLEAALARLTTSQGPQQAVTSEVVTPRGRAYRRLPWMAKRCVGRRPAAPRVVQLAQRAGG